MVCELTHFIGGKHTPGASGAYGDVCDPNTGRVQARVPLAGRSETEAAIADARRRSWSGASGALSAAPASCCASYEVLGYGEYAAFDSAVFDFTLPPGA